MRGEKSVRGKNNKIIKKKSILLVVLSILGVFLSINMNAEASQNEKTSLSIQYEAGESEFSLYQVANFSEYGKFDVIAPFKNYLNKIKGLGQLENLDSDDWRNLAFTLENLVIEDNLKATDEKKSDSKGNVSWENVPKGLYLILASQTKDAEYIYTPSPILVTVPNRDASGKWDAQVEIKHNKFEKEEIDKKTSLKIKKIWKDSENEKKRPSEIKVSLYKDGKVYDIVVLNAKNNWKHEWTKLSTSNKWTIAEKNVPDSYQVKYSKEGTTIYIVNEYEKPKEEKKPEKGKNEKEKELPQAGQLWWPVPILAMLGLMAILIGWIKRRA